MRLQSTLFLLAALGSGAACSSSRVFQDTSQGGSAAGGHASLGGTSSGGESAGSPAAGAPVNGRGGSSSSSGGGSGSAGEKNVAGDVGEGGSSNPSGGLASARGGAQSTSGGRSGSGGAEAQAGEGGSAGDPHPSNGVPYLVGYSIFSDSAGGGDDAGASLADATLDVPAGTQSGDFILVQFGADHSLGSFTGSDLKNLGWKLIDQHTNFGAEGQADYLMYRFAGSSLPANYVFPEINSPNNGNGVQALLTVYRGVDPTNPVNAYEVHIDMEGSEGSVDVTTATPAVTTTVPNCLAIAGLAPDSVADAPLITSWPDGFTKNRFSVNNPPHPFPFGWANIYSAERELPQAGALPASEFAWRITYGESTYCGALSFVLAIAPVPMK